MRVNNQYISEVQKTYNQIRKAAGLEKKIEPAKDDGIELSPQARFYSVAMQGLRDLPETEPKRLDALQESVKTGTYQVSNEEVAEKIYQENYLDKTV